MSSGSRRHFLGQVGLGVAGAVTFGVRDAMAAGGTGPKKGKVLLVIGDASETIDTLYPYFRVQEDGFLIVVSGPDKRLYPLVNHEAPPGWDITEERPSYHLPSDVAFRDVNPAEYIGLFLSGGRAPEYLRYDPDLMRIVKHFFDRGKPVGVVCHGAEIVAKAGVIRGKKMATVPKCRFDIEVCGATFVDEPVVRAGNMVSARTWHDYAPFFPVFMRMLHEASDLAAKK
jgi:protease I